MPDIATLTLNPAIDSHVRTEKIFHTRKVRTSRVRYQSGGGGINVSRILHRLGLKARTIYMGGATTGDILEQLIDYEALLGERIAIHDPTRISFTVGEEASGLEYRFVPAGPKIREEEWRACLAHLAGNPPDILVASGSLPDAMPRDFYAELLTHPALTDTKLFLDTSGAALSAALHTGGVHLVTPSLGEFEELTGQKLSTHDDIAQEAERLIEAGAARIIAVTMGANGALLSTREGSRHLAGADVRVVSAVGAGDSFLAAMTYGLAEGWKEADAFRLGMAAGTIAVAPPADLPYAENMARWYESLSGCRPPYDLPGQ